MVLVAPSVIPAASSEPGPFASPGFSVPFTVRLPDVMLPVPPSVAELFTVTPDVSRSPLRSRAPASTTVAPV